MSPNGPAMGNSALSALYSKLGKPDKAYELFNKSYKPNQVPPFGVLAETAGGTNPYFATGAGGFLQAVIFGFGGLKITDNGIIQNKSKLPQNWKSLRMKNVGTNHSEFIVK
jgi:protein-glucosylgalactosylhydroxylysine glucosidase